MPSPLPELRVARLLDEADRQRALAVMRATYRDEKHWLNHDDRLVDPCEMGAAEVSWFLALRGSEPVGVLRILYAPPLDLYAAYGFKLVIPNLNLDEFIRRNRIAEIGRFAVIPRQRGNLLVSAALMRTALGETVDRGFTHYITDVFEGETHSPLEFHTRVLGFEVVATHDVGELNCPNRRITLLLDIRKNLRRLRDSGNWLYRYLTEDWTSTRFAAAGLEIEATSSLAASER
ncbi:MAG: GNAT family N-acetyltransferase [Verrucomicrobiota bacterium]